MTLISGAEQALLYDLLIVLKEEERARFYFSRYEAAGTLGLLLAFPVGSTIAGLAGLPQASPGRILHDGGVSRSGRGRIFLDAGTAAQEGE